MFSTESEIYSIPEELNTPATMAAMDIIRRFGATEAVKGFCRAILWTRMHYKFAIQDTDDRAERMRLFDEYSKLDHACSGLGDANKAVNPELWQHTKSVDH